MANINRIEFSKTTITLFLSDGSYWPCLYTQSEATFLYAATPQQRQNYALESRDRAVRWPDLDRVLYLDDKDQVRLHVPELVAEQVAEPA